MNECTTVSVLKAPQNKGDWQPIVGCLCPEQCQHQTIHPTNKLTVCWLNVAFTAGKFAPQKFVFILPADCVCSLVTWPPLPGGGEHVTSTSHVAPCKCYSKSAGFLSQTAVCHCGCCVFMCTPAVSQCPLWPYLISFCHTLSSSVFRFGPSVYALKFTPYHSCRAPDCLPACLPCRFLLQSF